MRHRRFGKSSPDSLRESRWSCGAHLEPNSASTSDQVRAFAPCQGRRLRHSLVGGSNIRRHCARAPAQFHRSLRAVLAEHSTFDPKVGAAVTLAIAAEVGNGYMIRIASRLAHMNGWAEEQVTAGRTGIPTSDDQDRRADRPSQGSGCAFGKRYRRDLEGRSASRLSDEQLTDAFAYLEATVFTGYFLNYAQTDMDALWWIERRLTPS
jgi:hypothetical protein